MPTLNIRFPTADIYDHKVLTYVEYRAVSSVFQNIDPPSPSPVSTQRVCPPTAPKAWATLSPGGEGGGGSIFWKTIDIGFASYMQYDLSTYTTVSN